MLTGTAQVLGALLSAGAAAGNGSWLGVFKFIVAGLTGPIIVQEASEFIIAYCKVPLLFKPFVPRAISGAASGLLAWTGMDLTLAGLAGGYLMTLAELWNKTPWALDLELKLQGKTVPQPPVIPPAAGLPPAALLLLAFMQGASALHADRAIWNGGSIGSNIYDRAPDGSFSNAAGGVLVADEFAAGWGTLNADNTFSPYLALVIGAGAESRAGEQFIDMTIGLGTSIPGTPGVFVVGPAWRMGTGQLPGLAVAMNVPIGQIIKDWK